MTRNQFLAEGEAISTRAHVKNGLHGYFTQAAPRLHQSCKLFGLFSDDLGQVLELGPFFGYLPFILRPRATSYTVLEGDDPSVYPLIPLYKESAVNFSFVDFFDIFGPTQTAPHKLAFPDESFDTIICWETMEHFNFNPVKFVRELRRILKPNGRVYITVPNRARFQEIFSLLFSRGERSKVDAYYTFENFKSGGKTAFYGFHWREYAPRELPLLFTKAGFDSKRWGTFTSFHNQGETSLLRKAARILSQVGTAIFPRFGTNAYLMATKLESLPPHRR